jgi:hypothetical protein
MLDESTDLPEQEHSIKARGKELFVERLKPENSQPTKPFHTYLRETPAQPISTFTKVVLWMVAIVVFVLLMAALWRVSHRHGMGRRGPSPRPAAKTTMRLGGFDQTTRLRA